MSSIEDKKHFGPEYSIFSVRIEQEEIDGKTRNIWMVELGIRRAWPLSWFDHRPWEKTARCLPPVRTFIGRGLYWYEIKKRKCFGISPDFTALLNAIVSDRSADMIKEDDSP